MRKLILISIFALLFVGCDLSVNYYNVYNETDYDVKIVNKDYKYTIPANSTQTVTGNKSYAFEIDSDETAPVRITQANIVVRIILNN